MAERLATHLSPILYWHIRSNYYAAKKLREVAAPIHASTTIIANLPACKEGIADFSRLCPFDLPLILVGHIRVFTELLKPRPRCKLPHALSGYSQDTRDGAHTGADLIMGG